MPSRAVASAAVAKEMPDGPPSGMIQKQRLTAALTPLDVALEKIGRGLKPVRPVALPLTDALGRVAAPMPPLPQPLPAFNTAIADGWALCASDIVGASSYSPLPLSAPPKWVNAGDRLPDNCDCVVDAALVERAGPIFQVVAEAVPGQSVRRLGEDMALGMSIAAEGVRISPAHLLAARAAGLDVLQVRSARVRVVNIPAANGSAYSSQLIAELARAAGTDVVVATSAGRDAASIAAAFDAVDYDLLVLVGGTGEGCNDSTIDAVALRGDILAHGIALQPGRSVAVGRIGAHPVIALPGAPDQALAGWLTLVRPVLDVLVACAPRQMIVRPLLRKISSAIGFSEIVLLKHMNEAWMPLATGALALGAIVNADAWLAVPGEREGFAAGAPLGGFSLRDLS